MINPKEAVEDNHVLRVAVLFVVFSVVGILFFFTYIGGLKYWLLKGFGEPTEGTVVEYQIPDRSELADDQLPGTWVEIDYRDNAGNQKRLRFLRLFRPNAGPILETYTVLYLPANSSIAHPEAYLDDFRVDAHIALWSLVIGLVLGFMLARSIRNWVMFRRRMKQY